MPYNTLGDIQTLTLADGVSTDNACCILTKDNIITLMGNLTVASASAGMTLCTLPESMRPGDMPAKMCCVADTQICTLTCATDGSISIDKALNNGTVYLNGLCFNVCNQYYNSAIGNNFYQGTSPIRWNEVTDE